MIMIASFCSFLLLFVRLLKSHERSWMKFCTVVWVPKSKYKSLGSLSPLSFYLIFTLIRNFRLHNKLVSRRQHDNANGGIKQHLHWSFCSPNASSYYRYSLVPPVIKIPGLMTQVKCLKLPEAPEVRFGPPHPCKNCSKSAINFVSDVADRHRWCCYYITFVVRRR